MKSDLDSLMQAKNLDALLVIGNADHNPPMYYLTGGGHISPLGAFDAESDSVLVLDVNPASAGWVWMPVALLIRGMRTFDTVENRGYILVQSR